MLPRLTLLLTVLPALAIHPLPAGAQTIRGAGARLCAEWNQARQGGGRAFEAEQWALGYLSAVNAASAGKAQPLSRDAEQAAFASMDGFCRAHPDALIWAALKTAALPAHGA